MAEVRFRHADEEKWQEVRAIEVDGRRASVFEKWLDFTPGFLSLYAKWDPGMMIHAHGHNSDHVIFVLEGDMTCGDVKCTAGCTSRSSREPRSDRSSPESRAWCSSR